MTPASEPPDPTANDTNPPTPEELGWPPGFLKSTYGSIQDETFVAPPRPPAKPIPPLDAE